MLAVVLARSATDAVLAVVLASSAIDTGMLAMVLFTSAIGTAGSGAGWGPDATNWGPNAMNLTLFLAYPNHHQVVVHNHLE